MHQNQVIEVLNEEGSVEDMVDSSDHDNYVTVHNTIQQNQTGKKSKKVT
jgi:hypothetical protein